MSRQPKNNNEDGDNQPPSAPFQSRSTTRNYNNSTNNSTNNTKNKTVTYYQPSVHQFTCRGAFHLQPDSSNTTSSNTNSSSSERSSPPINNEEDLQNIIQDTFICNGIQSKLRHVSDYPLAPNKDTAIHWFEGSGNIGNNPNASIGGVGGQQMGGAMQPADATQQQADKENASKGADEGNTEVMESVEVEPDSAFSSYGTTQVNILTIKEIPVQLPKHLQDVNTNNQSSSLVNDPFGGFGSLGRPMGGMLNPFGSLFGDFFGSGGSIDPWSDGQPLDEDQQQEQDEGEGGSSDNRRRNPWLSKGSSSRSVSSSTRMERDEEGKRVVKTIQTTTIINNGKKRTEVVTTERHVDDGGRVETKKVVTSDDDNNDGGSIGEKKKKKKRIDPTSDPLPKGASRVDQKKRPNWPTERVTPSELAASVPAKALVGATYAQEQASSSPAEVAVIATDCLLGVSISDSASEDPDSALPPSKKNNKSSTKKNDSKSGWRKTEYLFKLGRFIPPFMLVAKYYKDEEEEQRRRTEMQKEYNELTNKLKKNRWDKSSERDTEDDKTKPKLEYEMEDNAKTTQVTNDLSDMSSRTEYYMQRIYVQMIKNIEMMEHLATNVIFKEDFPNKVQLQGKKIYNEIGPNAERTGELMQKVWDMWIGYASGKSGSGGGGWSSSGSGSGNK